MFYENNMTRKVISGSKEKTIEETEKKDKNIRTMNEQMELRFCLSKVKNRKEAHKRM
jgi:hypothetical protein